MATDSQPREGLQWLNDGRLSCDQNTGAIVNGELCLTAFGSSEDRTGAMDLFSLDTPNQRTTTVRDDISSWECPC